MKKFKLSRGLVWVLLLLSAGFTSPVSPGVFQNDAPVIRQEYRKVSVKPGPVRPDVARQPNILFCIADDASFAHMSANGCSWVSTPAFDRVAAEGLLFRNAYTPNAKCSPSRSAILTGRNPWQLEEAGNHAPVFPAKFKTFIETLGDNGYKTGFTGKGWAPGVALTVSGQPRQLTGQAYNEIRTAPPTAQMSSIDYAANFRAFLEGKPQDQPFCFWYGGHEPHRRYEYGSGVAKGGKKRTDIDQVPPYWPDNDSVRNDMLDYALEIEYFDRQLASALSVLEEAGQLENTLVIVTSDNGMPFPRVKGHTYEISNHLPLAVMWKKGIVNPGRVVDDYVSFIDFAPTILNAAGISVENSGMQPVQGKSLTGIFTSGKRGRTDPLQDHVILGRERNDVGRPNDEGYPVRAIVRDGFIYIRNYEPARWPAGNPSTGYLDTDGSPTKTVILGDKRKNGTSAHWDRSFGKRPAEELYNLAEDPFLMENLALSPASSQVKQGLRSILEGELKRQQDPRVLGNGAIFDRFEYANPDVRNFYERFKKGEKLKAGWVNQSDFEN